MTYRTLSRDGLRELAERLPPYAVVKVEYCGPCLEGVKHADDARLHSDLWWDKVDGPAWEPYQLAT